MSIRALSFPVRLSRTGALATVEQDTDEHVEELIAAGVLTRPGERTMRPGFGIADPAFVGWERLRLGLHLQDFGPEVIVEDVDISFTPTGLERVTLGWRRPESWEKKA